jgi:hypothetical protein
MILLGEELIQQAEDALAAQQQDPPPNTATTGPTSTSEPHTQDVKGSNEALLVVVTISQLNLTTLPRRAALSRALKTNSPRCDEFLVRAGHPDLELVVAADLEGRGCRSWTPSSLHSSAMALRRRSASGSIQTATWRSTSSLGSINISPPSSRVRGATAFPACPRCRGRAIPSREWRSGARGARHGRVAAESERNEFAAALRKDLVGASPNDNQLRQGQLGSDPLLQFGAEVSEVAGRGCAAGPPIDRDEHVNRQRLHSRPFEELIRMYSPPAAVALMQATHRQTPGPRHTAAIWHNDHTSQPTARSLIAYDH